MSHSQIIQNLYAAFGRGDLAAILNQLAEDVDWNHQGIASKDCPWNANFSGRGNVPGFFKALSEHLEFHTFEPHTFIDSGNHVAVLLRVELRMKKNGQVLANDSVHVWTFNERHQVSKYRHFNDTAAEQTAWRMPAK